MRPSPMHYYPLAWPFLLGLFLLFIVVVVLIELRILTYAYEKMGISRRYVFALLLLSLLGSSINIPVAELPPARVSPEEVVEIGYVRYIVPGHEYGRTIIAVNVGGALIPTAVSIYLLFKNRILVRGMIGVAILAFVMHWLAKPVPGLGISVPVFIPPLLAAGVGLLLAWDRAPALAYISGSLGTLIGADLMNLDKLQGLGAPVASIGGAGTFDAIFLTGILGVLLTPVGRRRYEYPPETTRYGEPRPDFPTGELPE